MIFPKHIGKTMEVYINDMLVKSKDETNHVEDIRATFDILRQF